MIERIYFRGKLLLFVLWAVVFLQISYAQNKSNLLISPSENEIFFPADSSADISSKLLEYLLIAEGNSDKLPLEEEWKVKLEKQADEVVDPDYSVKKKGKKLYEFLHKKILKKYSDDATILSLIQNGEFNCVTSSALYYYLAHRFGLPVLFHATTFHVCPVIQNEGKKIWVEMTDPNDGFEWEYNSKDFVEWLINNKLVTQSELRGKGEERIFNDFTNGNYRTSPLSILGYHYYNYGLKLSNDLKKEEAFWAFAKANVLEPNDKIIQKVYDASFMIYGWDARLFPSFLKATRMYFGARGGDTSVVPAAMQVVDRILHRIIETKSDFFSADSILNSVECYSFSSPESEKEFNEMMQFVSMNKAVDLDCKGRYAESFEILSKEIEKDKNNSQLQDAYVGIGLEYVQQLIKAGKNSIAISIVDSMRNKFPEYVKIRDEYIRIIIADVMATGYYHANPMQAREKLTKVFEMDSTNTMTKEALGSVYHELSMAEIRKSNYKKAKNLILQGLKIVPSNEFLLSDLDLINGEISKKKK